MANNEDMDSLLWHDDSSVPLADNFDSDRNDLKEQIRARYEQDTKFRHHLSVWVMIIVPTWMILVLLLVCLTGKGKTELSDTTMVALLSTTTVNVLGLAYIVLKGIFPESKDK